MTPERDGASAEYQASLAPIDRRVREKIAQITHDLGRPLRILHIGNIANNAYVNAKIMRRYDIEADVLVLDYYHIMGCPEWEEGVIEKLEGTQLDPDWHLTKVGNFQRPEWFLQGPVSLCAAYLNAKAGGREGEARWRHKLVDWNLRLRGATGGPRRLAFNSAWWTARTLPQARFYIRNTIYLIKYHFKNTIYLAGYHARNKLYQALYYLRRATSLALNLLRRLATSSRRAARSVVVGLLRTGAGVIPSALRSKAEGWFPSEPRPADPLPAQDVVQDESAIAAAAPAGSDQSNALASFAPVPPSETGALSSPVQLAHNNGYPKVEPIREDDIIAYGSTAKKLEDAFKYYDIVQGYAVDGIYPLLAGKTKGYACYEHGTLRDIPYQPNAQGRACAHAYRNAPAVFITNTDCVASAANLGIPASRRFPIPHAFDSDRVIAFRAEHRDTCVPHNKPVTFISPARHHWKHGEFVSWLKGNDVPIRAAHLLAGQGLDFKIIFVRWGQEVHESENLIKELGVERYFEWIEPVPKHRLWQYYMSCNGILDQFVIPAIGGVSFETLAFGRPLFTRIDEPVFKDFFGAAPPLLNVYTPEGLAAAMGRVIRDPHCYDELSAAAIEWTAKYHSSQRILEILLGGYDCILKPSEPDSAVVSIQRAAAVA